MAAKKKKILIILGLVVATPLAGGAGFVGVNVSAFESSMSKVYEVEPPAIEFGDDEALVARGQHLAESIGGCIECHGEGASGQAMPDMGPIGAFSAPNLTRGKGGVGDKYSDAQMARVIRHGIKADGTSAAFMPSQDFYWWPDEDVAAVIAWVRAQPPVDNELPGSEVGTLGKILDRQDLLKLDVARRIDHAAPRPDVPSPAATAEYGKYLAQLCMGCHGDGLSGGPIPGAPPELPTPTNLTPHATGIVNYTEADFVHLLDTGIKPDGKKLDPFMPIATTKTMNEIEKAALWAYLRSLPPTEFGKR